MKTGLAVATASPKDAFGAAGVNGVVLPDLGLDTEEAAEEPVVADEGIDEEALLRGTGEEALDVLVPEFGKLLAGLADGEGGRTWRSVDIVFDGEASLPQPDGSRRTSVFRSLRSVDG